MDMPALNPFSPQDASEDRPAHEPSMEEILASIRRIISDDQSLTAPRDQEQEKIVTASVVDLPIGAQPELREDVYAHKDEASPRTDPSETAPVSAEKNWPLPPAKVVSAPEIVERRDTFFKGPSTDPRILDLKPPVPAPKPAAARPAEFKPVESKPLETTAATSTYDDFEDMRLRRHLEEELEKPAAQPLFRPKAEPVSTRHETEPLVSPATDAAVATSFNTLFASRLMPSPEAVAEMTREMLRPMLKSWLDDNLPVMVERLVRAEIERVARGGR